MNVQEPLLGVALVAASIVAFWFGSSAGVALANMYPEAKSVGQWVRHGWHVAFAYVIGFFFMLTVLGWHPDPDHRQRASKTQVATTGNASSVNSSY